MKLKFYQTRVKHLICWLLCLALAGNPAIQQVSLAAENSTEQENNENIDQSTDTGSAGADSLLEEPGVIEVSQNGGSEMEVWNEESGDSGSLIEDEDVSCLENMIAADASAGNDLSGAVDISDEETEYAEVSGEENKETETEEGFLTEETEAETEGLFEEVADPENPEAGAEPEETETLNDPTVVRADSAEKAGLMLLDLAQYDGSFGNQLTGASRQLYNSRVSYYVTAGKTGTMELNFTADTSPVVFDAEVISGDGGKTYQLDRDSAGYQTFKNEVRYAMQSSVDAFAYDHPEIFWFRGGSYTWAPGKRYDKATGKWTGYVAQLKYTPGVAFDGAELLTGAYSRAVTQTVNQIAAGADLDQDGKIDEKELLQAAHDYLCNTLFYDYDSYASYIAAKDYRIFCSAPAFLPDQVGSGVVCEGYAKAFKVLCDRMGIPCVCIGGTVVQNGKTEGHMWNGVQVNGKWYLTDVTWDDSAGTVSYRYFLVGNTFTNRIASGNFGGSEAGASEIFVYPFLETESLVCCSVGRHNFEKTEDVEATCVQGAYTEYTCTICGITSHSTIGPEDPDAHQYSVERMEPTCTEAGSETYTCELCGYSYSRNLPALGHSYKNGVCIHCGNGDTIAHASVAAVPDQAYAGKAIIPSLTVKFGSNVLKKGTDYTVSGRNNKEVGTAGLTITGIGKYSGSRSISFKIVKKSVSKLSFSQPEDQTYSGKAKTPALTVRNSTVKLKKNTDYTLTYSRNKNVGTAVITVKGKGSYKGSYKVYFRILPQKPTLSRAVSSARGKMTVSWKKASGAGAYQIQYSTSSSFKNAKKVKAGAGSAAKTITNLKKGKTYYVRIRSYKTVDGKKYYSGWSSKKKVKIKK